MSVTVSVVVPVYKVEKYLDQCLASLVHQTLSGMEFILVNDGSPDRCGSIIDRWANQYDNIRVINQENSGYGTAVNNGMAIARGKYVAILESDDWVEPTMYERLYKKAEKYNAQIARCGFFVYDSTKSKGEQDTVWDETKNFIENCPDDVFSPDKYREIFFLHSALWTYLYRRDFIANIQFDSSRKAYQDYPFMFEVLAKCSSMVVVKEYLHHYRMEDSQGSSSTTVSPRALDMIDMTILARDALIKCNRLKDLSIEFYQHSIRANYYFFEKTPDKYKDLYLQKMHDFFCPFADELCLGGHLTLEQSQWFNKVRWYKLHDYQESSPISYPADAVHIVFCTDQNNIKYLAVALCSLVQHVSQEKEYVIHIVNESMHSVDMGLLFSVVSGYRNVFLHFIDVKEYEDVVGDLYIDRHLSVATYWRFLLPDILKNIDKALYLDTDIIVCQDLSLLYNIDLDSYLIGGCIDQAVQCCNFGDFSRSKNQLSKLGYLDFSSYINAGVLLMNLKLFREQGVGRELLTLVRRNKFAFHDQDAINLFCQGNVRVLDEKWNFTTHVTPELYISGTQKRMYRMIATWDIGIIHYPGATKPWNSDTGYLNKLWHVYALRTPYFAKVGGSNIIQQICNEQPDGRVRKIKLVVKAYCPSILWVQLRKFKCWMYSDNCIKECCKKILPKSFCDFLRRLRDYVLQ